MVWAIGEVDNCRIDEVNIHHATLLAMKIAAEKIFKVVPSETCLLCIDGKFIIPNFGVEQEAIVKGDNKIISIAAASIVAKVYRDHLMDKLGKSHPAYGFANHKGYGTLHHRQMIKKLGLSPVHRQTFCTHLA
jgi:ribonuclease HII